jgi:predicted Zn-ribbon and HTH transcriptional regulator
MREASQTTRERITECLRESARPASALAREFEIQTSDALDHVRHIARSLESTNEQLLVAPPECKECGFDGFDDLVNRPSRCPECKHESISEPVFRVE